MDKGLVYTPRQQHRRSPGTSPARPAAAQLVSAPPSRSGRDESMTTTKTKMLNNSRGAHGGGSLSARKHTEPQRAKVESPPPSSSRRLTASRVATSGNVERGGNVVTTQSSEELLLMIRRSVIQSWLAILRRCTGRLAGSSSARGADNNNNNKSGSSLQPPALEDIVYQEVVPDLIEVTRRIEVMMSTQEQTSQQLMHTQKGHVSSTDNATHTARVLSQQLKHAEGVISKLQRQLDDDFIVMERLAGEASAAAAISSSNNNINNNNNSHSANHSDNSNNNNNSGVSMAHAHRVAEAVLINCYEAGLSQLKEHEYECRHHIMELFYLAGPFHINSMHASGNDVLKDGGGGGGSRPDASARVHQKGGSFSNSIVLGHEDSPAPRSLRNNSNSNSNSIRNNNTISTVERESSNNMHGEMRWELILKETRRHLHQVHERALLQVTTRHQAERDVWAQRQQAAEHRIHTMALTINELNAEIDRLRCDGPQGRRSPIAVVGGQRSADNSGAGVSHSGGHVGRRLYNSSSSTRRVNPLNTSWGARGASVESIDESEHLDNKSHHATGGSPAGIASQPSNSGIFESTPLRVNPSIWMHRDDDSLKKVQTTPTATSASMPAAAGSSPVIQLSPENNNNNNRISPDATAPTTPDECAVLKEVGRVSEDYASSAPQERADTQSPPTPHSNNSGTHEDEGNQQRANKTASASSTAMTPPATTRPHDPTHILLRLDTVQSELRARLVALNGDIKESISKYKSAQLERKEREREVRAQLSLVKNAVNNSSSTGDAAATRAGLLAELQRLRKLDSRDQDELQALCASVEQKRNEVEECLQRVAEKRREVEALCAV